MTWPSRVSHLLRNLLDRDRVDHELDAELRAYVELVTAEKVRAGIEPAAARRAALRELGGVDRVKERVRDARGGALAEEVMRDAACGWRSLRRSPAFALAVILALGLGIGGATAMLSVVDSVLLRPLPYADAGRLVVLAHGGGSPVAPANFLDWRAQSRSFADVAAAEYWTPALGGGDQPEEVTALHLTAGMLPMLGVPPLLGRYFTSEEDQPGRNAVVVIGYGLWQRRFGSDPHVVGRTIPLDGRAYTIVGVMPREFRFAPFWTTHAELWAPLALGPRRADRNGSSLRIFARLRTAVSLSQARADLTAVAARLEQQFPGSNRAVTVTPLLDLVVGDVRTPLVMLLVAVGLLLLISCVNVAHMLLARAAIRYRELAVRRALGASRARLVRQLLTETFILAALGGVLGIVLAMWGIRVLVAASPAFLPRVETITVDPRVLGVTGLLVFAVTIAAGLLPAWRAAELDLARAFKNGDRGSAGAAGARLRGALVASEVMLALILLVGAGLLARSFVALRRVNAGFDARGVLTMTLSVSGTREALPEVRTSFYQDVLARVRALPNVSAAAMINHVPIVGDNWGLPFSVEGRSKPRPGEAPSATYRVVLPGYFGAMRISLVRGRDFSASDELEAPRVAIVNQEMARRMWPASDAIGKRLTFDDSTWVTVVGIAQNVVTSTVAAPPEMEIYLPYLQEASYRRGMEKHHAYLSLVARTRCDAAGPCDASSLGAPIERIVHDIDRNVALAQTVAMTDALDSTTADSRFYVELVGAFASVALALAGIGIFGVMQYLVAQRTREIGIRVALGAEPGRVIALVVGEGMRVTLLGSVAGIGAALLFTRLIRKMLYGVGAGDVWTFAGTTALLLATAALASYIPARRATRIDPLEALRSD